MVTKASSPLLTISAEQGEIYYIQYNCGYSTDIANNTDGNIMVSCKNDFSGETYLTLCPGERFNGLMFNGDIGKELYIKANGSGTVVLFRNGC